MIDPARPNKTEKKLLLQHYRKSQHALIRQRAHAVLLNSEGYSICEIAEILFRTEKTVREGIKKFNERRISSLFPKYLDNQNAAKLTKRQKEEIEGVLSRPPSEYNIPKEFWEVSSLKSYIKAEFGVEYESEESYRLIFKISDYSYHLPAKFSIKRNEELIKRRVAEIRSEIKELIRNPDWVVLVGDETRIVWETIIRRAWLPKGKKTILKVYRDRKYQNYLGFLNLKTGSPHIYKLKWQNQENIIPALEKLKAEHFGKRICVIWDNAGFHKGKKIREGLRRGNSLYGIYLINFPPHAPEKNPQEHVWEDAKEEIANRTYHSFDALVQDFINIVMSRTYHYKI